MRALIVSVGRKLWDAFNNDPVYDSVLSVQEKTLSDADLTLKDREDALRTIANAHPKS